MTGKAFGDLPTDTLRRVAIQARFDEETFAKGKVLAAVYGESFNAVLIRALKNEIRRYEEKYGGLPRQIDPGA